MRQNPILQKILDHKREEVALAKRAFPEGALLDSAAKLKGSGRSLKAAVGGGRGVRIIAEVKRSTPSSMLRPTGFDPAAIASGYENAGAAAISVLTDARFFCGSPLYVPLVRRAVSIPVLRKDFIIDQWQIAESAALGADAVLLMAVAIEDDEQLASLYDCAARLGLDVLMEIHSEEEWRRIEPMRPAIVGINNRDFTSEDLKVDMGATERLAPLLPDDAVIVSESGIASAADINRLLKAGADGFLIGSALMREDDPGAALSRLLAASRA